MPPLTFLRRPRSLLLAIALIAAALAPTLVASPVDAHGSRWGAAAHGQATKDAVGIQVYDLSQDGHCAVGRLHFGGRWRVMATDCTHSPPSSGVSSPYSSAGGSISAAACISGHSYTSSTCHYGTFAVPFGSVDLGNLP